MAFSSATVVANKICTGLLSYVYTGLSLPFVLPPFLNPIAASQVTAFGGAPIKGKPKSKEELAAGVSFDVIPAWRLLLLSFPLSPLTIYGI
jgi:hypothetical protein